ncbi:hypothetical protein B4135_1638 [Caldibacillus debilis]|uniref:Uncharacterized protein n=1 Tax=Caldibacillus debilis TaxID=301148 RepID=A0A150MAQ6_9BACI|nr:hypothetical protein B4135_1638 [Caldibacillus debilis]
MNIFGFCGCGWRRIRFSKGSLGRPHSSIDSVFGAGNKSAFIGGEE